MSPAKFRITPSQRKSASHPPRRRGTQKRTSPSLNPTSNGPPALLPVSNHLPAEIIAMIINELEDEIDAEGWAAMRPPYEDLLACCRTSRAFLDPARARLYHTARLVFQRIQAYTDMPAERRRWIRLEAQLLAATEQRLEATLVLNPHLATYVRRLEVHYLDRPCPALLTPSLSITHLFRACPLIHSFTLHNSGDVPVVTPAGAEEAYCILDIESIALAKVLRVCRPALSEVDLCGIDFQSGEGRRTLVDAVSHIPTLRKLSLGTSVYEATNPVVPAAPRTPSSAILTSLKILEFDPRTDQPILDGLLAASWDTLTHLIIHQSFLSVPTLPDLSRITNLKTLEWRFDREGRDALPHPSINEPSFQKSLAQLSHLSITSLRLSNMYTAGESSEDLLDDTSFLPTTLRHLRIPLLNPDALASFLLDDRSAELSVIELDEELGTNPNKWTPFTMGSLKAACRERRLQITCDGWLL